MTDDGQPAAWRAVERGQPETCDHPAGLRRPDNGDCLACPAPIILALDDSPQPGGYRFAGMSDAWVMLRRPDGTASEGVGRTLDEADADARRRSTGCYSASFGWVHVRPGCRCPG